MRIAIPLVLAALLFALTAAAQTVPVPEPPGYRTTDYRAPVPATVAGGKAIATAEAERLWRDKQAMFVDVLPAPRRPEGLQPDALWKPLPRRDIPGSLWLPDVGRGALSDALDAYFRAGLARATGGDKRAPVVFYCLADCWMSWNATKRAASYGYTRLYWYRDGTTGWEAASLPTEEATPATGRP
ncbi:MAG TPA: PQQ-dependent catabolism-associated CXXCW motif protein [Stellaceae bacterium]|nr:PQQ-dependent catabolism-associated CXXCW motif protein [Stellaceae bacterium]